MEKKQNKNWNRYILGVLAERPIAFIPAIAHLVGSASDGLFLSQMLYWCGKGYKGDWVFKTIEEMKKETCLSRSEQARAIQKWEQLGVLEKKVICVPPVRHFRLNITTLEKLLFAEFHIGVSDKSNCTDEKNTITEITPKNTDRYPVGINCPQHGVDRF